jgi:hypothetical protein
LAQLYRGRNLGKPYGIKVPNAIGNTLGKNTLRTWGTPLGTWWNTKKIKKFYACISPNCEGTSVVVLVLHPCRQGLALVPSVTTLNATHNTQEEWFAWIWSYQYARRVLCSPWCTMSFVCHWSPWLGTIFHYVLFFTHDDDSLPFSLFRVNFV